MLKATVSAMWVLDVSQLTLKVPATPHFFNNPRNLYLPPDVLAYPGLDAFYPILLFLAFGRYGFIPEIYTTASLYPCDWLEAAEINWLAEMLIATFHNIPLTEIVPADSNAALFPMLSPVTSPAIMQDEVLSKFFMYDCTSSDHGRIFCLGTQVNGFHDIKTLMRTTHPKLLTMRKVPEKKKDKPKDEWKQSPLVSDDEDWHYCPRKCMMT
uniref:Uncharacterized protein n=1 Tax=Romanomermis culicivorax TaxID=13658 RepID=A0A915JTM3_ROMCU